MIEAMRQYPDSWRTYTFRAMGCEMAVWLETADAATAAEAFRQVEALFATFEGQLSRFRADSELMRLNGRSGEWVVVSDLLWDVIRLALGMAVVTDGRFDPTLLNALAAYGYSVSFEQLDRVNSGHPELELVPGQWQAVQLDEARQAIRLPAGVQLDLGGIAKGYTADRAVAMLRKWGPCLVDAGGDLAAGAAPQGYPGWPTAISAPLMGGKESPLDLAVLWLADGGLATSGVDVRRWVVDGRAAHHLIDPANGRPAQTDGLTVTVLTGEAALAEAWATAALVAGANAGMNALLDAELAGLMVRRDGAILVTPLMDARLLLRQAQQPVPEPVEGSG